MSKLFRFFLPRELICAVIRQKKSAQLRASKRRNFTSDVELSATRLSWSWTGARALLAHFRGTPQVQREVTNLGVFDPLHGYGLSGYQIDNLNTV